MRKPHLRGRGPHFPPLDQVEQYPFEPRLRGLHPALPQAHPGGDRRYRDCRSRYYLPREAVRAEVLAASDHSARCPYKGTARHHHVTVNDRSYDNLVWYYPEPVHESARIKGRLCFYNERVDILLDGKPMPRPISPQSLPEQLLGNDPGGVS